MMESYLEGHQYVQPDFGRRPANEKRKKHRNVQNLKEGSYGVSIRVQGIDGHPFIVLNNKEGRVSSDLALSEENGPSGSCRAVTTSQRDSYSETKFSRQTSQDLQFPENPYEQYSRNAKQVPLMDSKNGLPDIKAGPPNTSNLFNFERHPELLQPYDPEKKASRTGTSVSPVYRKSTSPVEEEKKKVTSSVSSRITKPSQKPNVKLDSVKTSVKGIYMNQPIVAEDQNKPPREFSSITSSSNEMLTSESCSSSGGSPYNISPVVVQQEPKKTRPDVLPFRRQDSASAVLDVPLSRRSSSSSTTPTSAHSLYKYFLDDQEDALHADNVNRHENRRYIPFKPGTGRDIDTEPLPEVDQLIEKFDQRTGIQRRGRSAKRNRIHPDDRKRARSVDSALPFGLEGNSDYLDEFSRNLGKSTEHLLRPSQVCQQRTLFPEYKFALKQQTASGNPANTQELNARTPNSQVRTPRTQNSNVRSLQYQRQNTSPVFDVTDGVSFKSSSLPRQSKQDQEFKSVSSTLQLQNRMVAPTESKPVKITAKSMSPVSGNQATPDLLKGQQELAQQTNEETAKQILYNYLKEGSVDNDDATKRKVNLVFEKIQTLKSRAAGGVQASEPSVEVKTLMDEKCELEKKLSDLQKKLDQEIQNHLNSKEEKDRTRANMKDVQQHLDECITENNMIRERLSKSEKELRKNLEELFQVKMEREQNQTEIRDLQDQLSEMHDELDEAKNSGAGDGEREALIEELMQMKQDLQEVLQVKEEQEEVLRKRERELTALKGALKEEVSSHDQEIDKLKEHYEKELKKLKECMEEATQNSSALLGKKSMAEQMRASAELQVKGLTEENEQLKKHIRELELKILELNQQIEDMTEEEDKMKDKLKRSEREKQQLENALEHAGDQEKQVAQSTRMLQSQLEDAQRNLSRVGHEQQQLMERLKEEATQKEQLKRMKNEMENERWQLDKTIDKLQKEIAEIVDFSRTSTLELQKQFDEYKEKNRREFAEVQKQLKDKHTEAEKARLNAAKLQDELRHMEEDLRDHQRAQDESLTKCQLLEQTIKDLEYELDSKSHLKDDRARHAKLMEDKVSQLEMELDEEKNNCDLLTERITRTREQIEQTRNELLQERAARQDLECDKISLERQNKDLRSRISHLENSYRSNKEGIVAQMETRIAELEARLESDDRDRANLQLSNRRLERKVKELMMQVDDDHLSLTDQKDQLSLRLKAMKRQVEEAEEEIDRLESAKKKLQRDLEEQVDINDQLQGQLTAARKELSRRKSSPSKMLNDLDDDDDFSTDGESLYEAPSGYKYSKDNDLINYKMHTSGQ
ncbi:cingulin-like protein 1 [Ambystoma mexicanum]|uniref:cingulin-like protein 1 n=1 Tax=Ambystoma mexicanum TaxID=8296 RepID=UPI0037E7D8BE